MSYKFILNEKEAKNKIVAQKITPAEILSSDNSNKTVQEVTENATEKDNITAEKSELKLLFFGDLMLDRHVGEKINKNGLNYIFEKLNSKNFFSGYDMISANLEGAVTNEGEHYKPDMAYDFAFRPELIEKLKQYNFNFFNLANNHLADQGERGIIETRNNLEKIGYSFVGCRDREASECSATTLEMAGREIGFAGFSQVYGTLDEKKVIKTITELKNKTELVIVNIHWGVEYQHKYNSTQQNIARKMIDAGADVIIGHHPHVVQGMEVYKNRPIFYSLGNFVFDQYFSPDTQEELAVKIVDNTNRFDIRLSPMKSVKSQVEEMNDSEKIKFYQKFISWSSVDDKTSKQIKDGNIIIYYE